MNAGCNSSQCNRGLVSRMYQGWGLRRYLTHDTIINDYSDTSCVLIGLRQKSLTHINPSSAHVFTIQGKCPPSTARVFNVDTHESVYCSDL